MLQSAQAFLVKVSCSTKCYRLCELLGVCFRLKIQCETAKLFIDVCVCISFHAGRDFNDTVIVTEVPEAQTLLVHAIQIFDDEINEGREVFDVFLEVVGNITNMVTYRIQTTLCRIRQSDRKLSCKICMHLMYPSQD